MTGRVLVLCNRKWALVFANKFCFTKDNCRCWCIDAGRERGSGSQRPHLAVGIAKGALHHLTLFTRQIRIVKRGTAP
jgi:hypothetical protein